MKEEKKKSFANSKNWETLITKKKKKAFTLIELLAIIVILAIIAVITVPIILNIIENSKKGAATDSAYGYKDSVNKWYVSKLTEDHDFKLNGEYDVLDGKLDGTGADNVDIPVSGNKPSSGKLYYSNNILTDGCLVFGDYAVTFDGNETSTIKGECDASSSLSTKQYGFKSIDENTGEETEIIPGTSGYSATNQNVYLKYEITNEGVVEGTVPEACVYNSSNSKELCLTFGEDNYNANVNKIKAFVGFDEDKWRFDNSEHYWIDADETMYCSTSSGFWCNTGILYFQVNNANVSEKFMVLVENDKGIRCDVSASNALCEWP